MIKFLKKSHWFTILYSILLIAFTAYVLLDAFVIPRSYVVVDDSSTSNSSNQTSSTESTSSGNASSTTSTSTAAVTTSDSYSDDNISITISTYREYDTDIYVADITLSDISYLQTAFANNTFGKNVTATTSEIASENDAILAINGDFYGTRNGYVIRNGTLYRSTSSGSSQEDLAILSDGSFSIFTEGSLSTSDLIDEGALQVFSFGPTLISDGEVVVSSSDEVDKAMTSNPRTAIGIIDNLHYVMVVSDGRTDESTGLSLYHLASVMSDLGVTTLYNLDGGGSSTMYFNGEVVNNPTTNGNTISERSVSDIVYIGY